MLPGAGTQGRQPPAPPTLPFPGAPSALDHTEQTQKWGKKMGFSLSQDTVLLGEHGEGAGEPSLTTAPRHRPSANKSLAQGKAAASIPTRMSRPAAVDAKDAADAEQRLFPRFGSSVTAPTSPCPPACQ